MDNYRDQNLCVLQILLKSTFCILCHFFIFRLNGLHYRTLTQDSEASTPAVQMSTVRHGSKPIPSQQLHYLTFLLFPYRFSFKRFLHQHSGCLLSPESGQIPSPSSPHISIFNGTKILLSAECEALQSR
jgi:hypothetical protein